MEWVGEKGARVMFNFKVGHLYSILGIEIRVPWVFRVYEQEIR